MVKAKLGLLGLALSFFYTQTHAMTLSEFVSTYNQADLMDPMPVQGFEYQAIHENVTLSDLELNWSGWLRLIKLRDRSYNYCYSSPDLANKLPPHKHLNEGFTNKGHIQNAVANFAYEHFMKNGALPTGFMQELRELMTDTAMQYPDQGAGEYVSCSFSECINLGFGGMSLGKVCMSDLSYVHKDEERGIRFLKLKYIP